MTGGSRPGGGSRLRRRARDTVVGWAFIGPAMIVVMGLTLFPALWAFYISQLKWNGINKPRAIGFSNYTQMADDADLWQSVWHTGVFAAMYVPASVLLGMVIAVALNRDIRFVGIYRTCVFLPFVVSAAVNGIVSNYLFDPQVGLVNSFLRRLGLPPQKFLEDASQAMAVISVMALWTSLAFTVVVYLAALQDIPHDVLEAARIDGAGRWQTFRHVILPELMPVTVFATVWQIITALQVFDLVYTTTRGGPVGATKTIVFYLWDQAFQRMNFGYGSAVAYLLFVVTLLITLGMFVYSRYAKVRAF